MKNNFHITILVLLFASGTVLSQNNVAISDGDDTETDPKAVLHLKSESRGLLLPKMTEENMLNILNPADGLMVYVISDGDELKAGEGIYYFDLLNKNWTRLKRQEDGMNTKEPVGTIVAYVGGFDDFYRDNTSFSDGLGKLGTDKFGWAVCNGQNGTPDLTGNFMVGSASEISVPASTELPSNTNEYNSDTYFGSEEYTKVGQKGNQENDKIIIKEENFPKHKHEVSGAPMATVKHTHDIVDAGHDHPLQFTRGNAVRKEEKYLRPQRDRERNNSARNQIKFKDTEPSLREVTLKPYTGKIDLDFPSDALTPYGVETPVKIENRPMFYKVFYIIKVGTTLYNDGYNQSQVDCVNSSNTVDSDCFQTIENASNPSSTFDFTF